MSWFESTVEKFRDLNLNQLKVDEAYINITNNIKNKLWLYYLSADCYKCPYTKLKVITTHNENNTIKVNTARDVTWKFFDKDYGKYAFNNATEYCKLRPALGEFGVYDVSINEYNNCEIITALKPVNIYLPMLFVFLFMIFVFAIGQLFMFIRKRQRQQMENTVQEEQMSPTSSTNDLDTQNQDALGRRQNDDKVKMKKRLRSLDTFRGISIVLMIFVNSGGGHYWWIEHATWNGLHIADLVFPWFLWIMGVCIPMSIKSQLNRNISKSNIMQNILIRSVKLFAIGFCLNTINGPKLNDLRIFGVLQRFGIAYLAVGCIYTICIKSSYILPQNKYKRLFYDIIILLPQWCIMFILIILHLLITFYYPVPDCPTGYLGPGGKHNMGDYKNCIGGATGYIDRVLLGSTHIYQRPTARSVYDSQPFDPEGVFGCLLTIVQVFFGVQCGVILMLHSNWLARVKRWLSWALLTGFLAGLLCGFDKENGFIPVNKNMWSLSYVMTTTCFAYILITLCYVLIDIKHIWNGKPFLYPGMNAIIIYVGHTIFHKMLPWHWSIGFMNTHFLLLTESLWNTILWICISYYLYSKKIFYSI